MPGSRPIELQDAQCDRMKVPDSRLTGPSFPKQSPSYAEEERGTPHAMPDNTLMILMPVYNVGRFVAEAIESVLAQTHPDFELRIYDDGSTDDTLDVCRKYEKQDARIRVRSHTNIGIANTMNAALAEAQAEWIFCMHGDDVMTPNRLERQLAFIRANPDLAVVSSVVELIDSEGRELGQMKSRFISRKNVIHALARMLDRLQSPGERISPGNRESRRGISAGFLAGGRY